MKNVFFQSILLLAFIATTLSRPPSPRLEPRNQKFCPNPAIRVSWSSFNQGQKQAMKDAIKCLMKAPTKMKYPGAVTRYDDLVAIHQLQSDYPDGHDLLHVTARFLFWHRLYMFLFELLLRVECGYTGQMAYWDEKADAGNFRSAEIVKDFGGAGNENGYLVDGDFGYTIVNLGPRTENRPRYLRRQINETASAFARQEKYDLLMSQNTFSDFMNIIRTDQHLSGHLGVRGEMGDVQTAPVDPLFFFHHMYVDYLWFTWQNVNPSVRLFDLKNAGYETQAPPFKTATWHTALTFLGLADDVPLYAAADTQGGFLCYIYQ